MSKKVLIVAPRWMGDAIMLQSLVGLLQEADPSVVVDILAPPMSAAIFERLPGVRRTILNAFERRGLNLRKRLAQGRSLRAEGYDQSIVWTNSWKAALVPWAAKIPVRTGWLGEQRYGLLNDIRPLDKERFPGLTQRFLTFTTKNPDPKTPVSFPRLSSDPEQSAALADRFSLPSDRFSLPSDRLLMMCPGTAQGNLKCWPAEHCATLAEHYHQKGWSVALMGAPNDAPIASAIEALLDVNKVPVHNLVGKTTLLEAIDCLALATVVVSNDSGLMHAAAALGKPVVAIYGPTPKDLAPPLTNESVSLSLDLPCQPCRQAECPLKHHRCMKDLSPDLAIAAVKKLAPCSPEQPV